MALLLLSGLLVLAFVALPKLDAMRRGAGASTEAADDDEASGTPEPPGHTLTTDIAMVVVFALGAFAQSQPLVAMGAALVVSLLLASREKVHDAVTRPLSTAELRGDDRRLLT
jgi:hypothetical protein